MSEAVSPVIAAVKKHSPRLATIRMVEQTIQAFKEVHPTPKQLWKALPREVQWSTYKTILNYLEESNKIIKSEGEIVWIRITKEQLKKFLKDSVSV